MLNTATYAASVFMMREQIDWLTALVYIVQALVYCHCLDTHSVSGCCIDRAQLVLEYIKPIHTKPIHTIDVYNVKQLP
jgi:hypothetical protein